MLCIRYICLIFSVTYISEANSFRYDYQYFEDSQVWLKLHKVKRSWHDARNLCHMEGAELASPVNENFTSVFVNFARNNNLKSVYTGVHATLSSGVWQSIEGTPLERFENNFIIDDLDRSERQCAVLQATGMLGVKCSEQHTFICYKPGSEVNQLSACGTTDAGYELEVATGSCYKFHRVAETWHKAFEICSAEGAYLAIINSDTESKILEKLFNRNKDLQENSDYTKYTHIGFLDWEGNRRWYTIHGGRLEDSGYFRWQPHQPDNVNGRETCGSMYYYKGLLNDIDCGFKLTFICEKDVKSLEDKSTSDLDPTMFRIIPDPK